MDFTESGKGDVNSQVSQSNEFSISEFQLW